MLEGLFYFLWLNWLLIASFCSALSCCEKRTLPSPAENDSYGKLSALLYNLLCPTCHKYREGELCWFSEYSPLLFVMAHHD